MDAELGCTRSSWFVLASLALTGCGRAPPTIDDIRNAYTAHVRADRVHEKGLGANEAPLVIPKQEPACSPDGGGHFDCRVRVIFETAQGRQSEEQIVHIRRDGGAWVIESMN